MVILILFSAMNHIRHQLPVGNAITSVFSLKSACVQSTELDAPESDRFSTDSDASFSYDSDWSRSTLSHSMSPFSLADIQGLAPEIPLSPRSGPKALLRLKPYHNSIPNA